MSFALCLGHPAIAGPDGRVRVVDGDTIRVGGTTVRLHAIDAPEADQMCGDAQSPAWGCGAWVTAQLRARFEGKRARCEARDTDRYGRIVAKCAVEGHDMGEVIVSEGWAFAYRRYGMDYDLTEKRAAVAGRGLHGTGVMSPAAFRAARREAQMRVDARDATGARTVRVPQATDTAPDWKRSLLPNALNPDCQIKGNVSRSGARIYHVPGQRHYEDTRISRRKGERWFCSEAEARAAGWRKARK